MPWGIYPKHSFCKKTRGFAKFKKHFPRLPHFISAPVRTKKAFTYRLSLKNSLFCRTYAFLRMKVLVIEDDRDLREIISRSLEKERYVVETAATLRAARQKALGYEYDCILLDIMLPDGSGLDLLRLLHERKRKVNVIILSARDAIEDKVLGLDLGADDYLAKPFHLAELHARLKSVLRRKLHNGEQSINIGNVSVFPDSFKVQVAGNPVELGRKEYDILLYFMNRPERLVEKHILAEAVWGDYIDQADNFDFIYAQVKNLRKRLKEAGADIEIKTVYGFGYKLTSAR